MSRPFRPRRRLTAFLLSACFALSAAPGLEAQAGPEPPRKKVAVLVFDQVQTIDFAAPVEVLSHHFDVFTVGPTRDPVPTSGGFRMIPDYALADAPPADVLVIPGGGGPLPPGSTDPLDRYIPLTGHPEVIAWIQARAARSEIVLSVCNGAFLLFKAGLLDGLEATTTVNLLAALQELAPRTRVRSDRRFIDNGKVITAGGLTAGMDASLHVVERLLGRGVAQQAALGLEYRWDPEGRWSRANLADRHMAFLWNDFNGAGYTWSPLEREGDTVRWHSRWRLAVPESSPLRSTADVQASFEGSIEKSISWRPLEAQWARVGTRDSRRGESRWTFRDRAGDRWNGRSRVAAEPGEPRTYFLEIEVQRAK